MDVRINIDVDDLEKAVRFYSAAFGLHAGCRFGTFGAEMLGSSVPIYSPSIIDVASGAMKNCRAPELRPRAPERHRNISSAHLMDQWTGDR